MKKGVAGKRSGSADFVGSFLRRAIHLKVDSAGIAHGLVAECNTDASRTNAVTTFRRKRCPAIVAGEHGVAGDLQPSRNIPEGWLLSRDGDRQHVLAESIGGAGKGSFARHGQDRG